MVVPSLVSTRTDPSPSRCTLDGPELVLPAKAPWKPQAHLAAKRCHATEPALSLQLKLVHGGGRTAGVQEKLGQVRHPEVAPEADHGVPLFPLGFLGHALGF